jgi:hypothetical protein
MSDSRIAGLTSGKAEMALRAEIDNAEWSDLHATNCLPFAA